MLMGRDAEWEGDSLPRRSRVQGNALRECTFCGEKLCRRQEKVNEFCAVEWRDVRIIQHVIVQLANRSQNQTLKVSHRDQC